MTRWEIEMYDGEYGSTLYITAALVRELPRKQIRHPVTGVLYTVPVLVAFVENGAAATIEFGGGDSIVSITEVRE